MALKRQIEDRLKTALKDKDQLTTSTLRLVLNAIKNAEIDRRGELDDGAVTKILGKEAKQRQDSIRAYQDGGREDLAAQEAAELKVIEEFLPSPLDDKELAAIIDSVVSELKPTGPADMGKVMGAVNKKVAGRAPGGQVAGLVKERLSRL